jgi:hypothetical protein
MPREPPHPVTGSTGQGRDDGVPHGQTRRAGSGPTDVSQMTAVAGEPLPTVAVISLGVLP